MVGYYVENWNDIPQDLFLGTPCGWLARHSSFSIPGAANDDRKNYTEKVENAARSYAEIDEAPDRSIRVKKAKIEQK